MKKVLLIMSIIFLLIGTGIIIYMAIGIFQTQLLQSEETVKKDNLEENFPVVYYNDLNQNGATVILLEGDVFRYKPITIIKNGKPIEYKEERLEDGEYCVIVTGKDKEIKRNFIVDTTPPKFTGITSGKFTQPQTITFDDVEDVEKATITNKDTKQVIDIKKHLTDNKTNQYTTPSEKGRYEIRIEDKYGNGVNPISIVIQ